MSNIYYKKEGMKYLITGHRGFVGKHLISFILSQEPDADIFGLDLHSEPPFPDSRVKEHALNLLNKEQVDNVIKSIVPNYVIHLASFSSVGYSWENPIDCFQNNTTIFLNLLESIRNNVPDCRILSVGSSEEYGNVSASVLPLTEDMPLNPVSPYAVARVAQEQLSLVYAKGYDLDIVCTRSFNHIGASQKACFVVSSIAKKFVELQKGSHNKLSVGNIDVIRDFSDVRDVVRAYYELIHSKNTSGEVFNICTSNGVAIRDIITMLSKITGVIPEVVIDPLLLRPVENAIVIGSYEKIKKRIGWNPEIPIENSLKDIINWWQQQIR